MSGEILGRDGAVEWQGQWRAMAGSCYCLLPFQTSHQSGEVSMGSFCRLPGTSGYFPCPLSALEEHNFLFQLRGGEQPPPGAKEVSWYLHRNESIGNG